MAKDRFFKFKDYDQIYTSKDDRSPEQVLAAEVLFTFVIDAEKISNNFRKNKMCDLKHREFSSHYLKYNELAAPPLSEFLNDLVGESCQFYCDIFNLDHDTFVERVKRFLPEKLLE